MNVCQVCGGSIHPLAGRCKHCKADLSAQRTAEARARRGAMATPVPTPVTDQGSEPAPTARASSQPAYAPPPSYRATPGGWRSKWPLAVAAVALVAISFSAGILIERSRSGDKKNDDIENKADASTKDKAGAETKKSTPNQQPHARVGNAPAVDAFLGTVTKTVCGRLNSCGMLNNFSKQLCDELSRQTDPTAAARVRSGQCKYDKVAAASCLTNIRQLKCNASSANVMDWVGMAGKLGDCTSAFRCR